MNRQKDFTGNGQQTGMLAFILFNETESTGNIQNSLPSLPQEINLSMVIA